MVNHSVMRRLSSLYIVLTVIIPSKAQEYLLGALSMISVVTVPEDVARISRTYMPVKAVISFVMNICDHPPHILPKMQDQISLTLC